MITQQNTAGPILIFSMVIIIGSILLGYYLTPEPIDSTPRVGDIWEHYGTGDPFIEDEISIRRILDIKFGYVQYVENDRDTLSKMVTIFKYNSVKIKSNIIKKDSI